MRPSSEPTQRAAEPHARVHRPSDRWVVIRRAIAPLLAILLVLWVVIFPYPPLQDYPDWLYQGFLFREYLFAGNTFGSYFALQPYVPPNAISTLLIGLLSAVFDPIVAGKIALAAGMLLLFVGIERYIRLLSGRWTMVAPLLAFLFVFNENFLLGNLSFIIGLGVALIGFELLIRRGWTSNYLAAASVFLLAYLSHFFAYAILLYAVSVYMLVDRRELTFWRLMIVNLPSLLLLAWFVSSMANGGGAEGAPMLPAGAFDLVGEIKQRLFLFAGVLLPFQRFKGMGDPPLPLQVINYLFTAAIAGLAVLMLVRRSRTGRSRFPLYVAAPLPLVILLLPLGMAGIVRPGERLVLFFVINLVAVLLIELPRYTRIVSIVLAPLCALSFAYYVERAATFNAMIAEGRIPPHEERMLLAGKGGTDGFLRLPYYTAIRMRQPVPIFTSGLFTYVGGDSLSPKTDSLDRAR